MKENENDKDVRYWWIFPYRWHLRGFFKDLWNPAESRIFPPKQFGIGWGLNFAAIIARLRQLV